MSKIETLLANYPELFSKLEKEIKIGQGWVNLLEHLCLLLNYNSEKTYILNVQKRYGIMDINYIGNKEVPLFVNKTIKLSQTTCEQCSSKGFLYSKNGTHYSELWTMCQKDALNGLLKRVKFSC